MGGSLQRIEILLIGLALLLAGAIVALLTIVRPVAPSLTTQRVATTMTLSAPTAEPALAAAAPTRPAAAPMTPAATPAIAVTTPGGSANAITVPGVARTLWPLLLLATGCLGLPLATLRARRRRMPYTRQSVGQLLATADSATRASNIRVMHKLAEQGVLTADLAAAAGIDLRRTARRRWNMQLPRIRWPHLVLPAMRWPRPSIPSLAWASWPAIAWHHLVGAVRRAVSVVPGTLETLAHPGGSTSALVSLSAELPMAVSWTAEDRVLAVATALTELWVELKLHTQIVAFDTPRSAASGVVCVTFDIHPNEEQRLDDLPRLLLERRPAWRVSWRRNVLEIVVAGDDELPTGGPLFAPVLAHGRGNVLTRFVPLASWPHLGIYGGAALGALHAMLGSLLYAHAPSEVALAIIDHGEITPLYRDVAHFVPLPDTPIRTIELLVQLLRRGALDEVRRMLLVVVEPDDVMLTLLNQLFARLQARPGAPLHLMIIQERPRNAGHDLYALLPALITGGQSSAAQLPGQRDWPKPGEARLVARGMRIEGRAIVLDESAIAVLLAQLRGSGGDCAPVLWDVSSTVAYQPPTALPAQPDTTPGQDSQHCDEGAATATNENAIAVDGDLAYHRRRIIAAITHRRQLLLSAEDTQAGDVASRSVPAEDLHNESVAVMKRPLTPDRPLQSRRAGLLRATVEAGDRNAPSKLAYTQPLASTTNVPIVDHPQTPLEEPDNGWPVGPAPLGRVALAELMARVVAAPAIVSGPTNEQGITKNRLVELLKGSHKAQAKELAEVLLAWFDLAGLLVEPTRPGRLRHPRALLTTDLGEIATRLAATACPDQQTVSALWADSHERRSE